jgi:hypothetical protein
MQTSIRGPGRYIAAAEISTLRRSRPTAGRRDWKYPLHTSTPIPRGFLPSGVKKDLEFEGYFLRGTILMAMFKACMLVNGKKIIIQNVEHTISDI